VADGEFVAIVGPTGCGKSTLSMSRRPAETDIGRGANLRMQRWPASTATPLSVVLPSMNDSLEVEVPLSSLMTAKGLRSARASPEVGSEEAWSKAATDG